MAFQIKDFRSIAGAMLNRMRATTTRITDFSRGSVARTLVEAPAQEMDELYQQLFLGLREAIPAATYRSFDFPLQEATAATGVLRVTITPIAQATLIPAGSLFTRTDAGAIAVVATADTLIPAMDSFGDVPVVAASRGAAGNAPATTAFTMASGPQGIVSIQASGPISGGLDAETEAQRRERFRDFINTLARATPAALIYGAKQARRFDAAGREVERVVTAAITEPYLTDVTQTPGLVHVHIHNGVGSTSAALIARAQQVIEGYTDPATGLPVPGWKAAGVQVVVFAATEQAVNITADLQAKPGATESSLAAAASAIAQAYLRGLAVGEPFLRAELVRRVMALPGVRNFVLTAPAADVTPGATVKLVPGTVAIA